MCGFSGRRKESPGGYHVTYRWRLQPGKCMEVVSARGRMAMRVIILLP